MNYYSTNHQSASVSLEEAVMRGLADDGGLFLPEKIPELPKEFFNSFDRRPFQDTSSEIAKAFFGEDIPDDILDAIVHDALNFDAPLVKLDDWLFALELFHGPTLAFKDFAARFMARLMSYFNRDKQRELIVLVATSGDTGSAVASGFFNVPGIRVVILYPSGNVSELQERQLTAMGGNITTLEVHGTFDDCQRMAKEAFQDKELNEHLQLTSANSINVARLIPQSFYYVHAFAQLKGWNNVVVSVPSGNFGNLTAGLIARRMGLPVKRFIAATNVNDVVPRYLDSGVFTPRLSRKTLSNAMDVGNPSNFVRMVELYEGDVEKMREDIVGFRFTDEQTKSAMREVHEHYGYILDPHGAVGYLGFKAYQEQVPEMTGIFLETAHPAKFRETVEEVLGISVDVPERLALYTKREKVSVNISNSFDDLKQFLLSIQ